MTDPRLKAAWEHLRATSRRRFELEDPELLGHMRHLYARVLGRTRSVNWFHLGAMQAPSDYLMYVECFERTRPRVIVETGTAGGASARFFAEVLERIHGSRDFRVVTVERYPTPGMAEFLGGHPCVVSVIGDSADPVVAAEVAAVVPAGWPVAVTLDSDHSAEHVLAELSRYADFVSPGQHLIVQDTYLGLWWGGNLDGEQQRAVLDGRGGDLRYDYHALPLGAVEAFLEVRPEFSVDLEAQRWLVTQHPYGWLQRA